MNSAHSFLTKLPILLSQTLRGSSWVQEVATLDLLTLSRVVVDTSREELLMLVLRPGLGPTLLPVPVGIRRKMVLTMEVEALLGLGATLVLILLLEEGDISHLVHLQYPNK